MQLLVCGRVEADALLSTLPASVGAVVSLAYPSLAFDDFKGPKLLLHDPPRRDDIVDFLAFVGGLPRCSDACLLLQCRCGNEFAPAFGYALLCQLWGRGAERQALMTTVRSRTTANPSRLVVETADRALTREGAMVEALERWQERRAS